MIFFKLLFFVIVLSISTNSHAEAQASVSVMDVIDRGEDYYVLLSKKVKTFFCGDGNQEMETSMGRLVKSLLSCGNKNESIDTNTNNEQVEDSSINSSSLPEQTPDIPDFDFVTIEPNSFTMGSPKSERFRGTDEDQVEVTISRAFEIMATEVTQREWFIVMGYNPSYFSKSEYCSNTFDKENNLCSNHPVESVSWNMAQEFINELNRRTNLSGCDGTPDSASGCYRLPTEAEWEFAARAGTKTTYYFGDDPKDLEDHAWYRENSNRQTHAVRGKTSNDNGLYDVHGNVWEWVQDGYPRNLPGGTDPLVNTKSYRILRGGSWGNSTRNLRSAFRRSVIPDIGIEFMGLRFVRTL